MRYILTNNLKSGMVVGKSLYNSNNDILLREGVQITEGYIRQLQSRGVNGVYINDLYSAGTPIIKDIVEPELRKSATKEVKTVFEKVIQNKHKYNLMEGNNDQASKSAAEIIEKIISNLIKNENVVVNMVDIRTVDEGMFSHSVNVAILSLIVGVAMKLSSSELYDLGMAAILHDIPKAEFCDELRQKEKLNQMKIVDKIRARLLIKKGCMNLEKQDIPQRAKKVIIEHSQRVFQDDDLPISKLNEKTSVMAQIIGLCDVYDDLVSGKQDNLLPSDAMELIMGYSNTLFSLDLVRVFTSKVAIYPIGTPVRLSTGELAIVTNNFIGRTTRPVVKILKTNAMLNLFDSSNLSITIVETYNLDEIKALQQKIS